MANHDHTYGGEGGYQQQNQPMNGETSPNHPQHQQPQQYMMYPLSESISHAPPPSAQQPQVSDTMAGFSGNENASFTTGASHLDHALLESLFYNEMVLLDSTSTSSPNSHHRINSDFISHHLAEVTHQDPNTIVEKEILRDFGVGTPQRGASATATDSVTWQQHAAPHPGPIPPPPSSTMQYQAPPYPPSSSDPPVHHHTQSYHSTPPTQAQRFSDQQTTATAAAAAAAVIHPPHVTAGVLPQHHQEYQQHSFPPIAAAPSSSPPVPPPPLRTEPPVAMPSNTISQVVVPQGKARQLVDQFATLASRLGIDLPDTVLERLTAAAAKNDPSLVQQNPSTTGGATTMGKSSTSDGTRLHSNAAGQQSQTAVMSQDENTQPGSSSNNNNNSNDSTQVALPLAPTIEELRKTAEEAIAAVTSTRKRSYEHQDSAGSDVGGDNHEDGNNNNFSEASQGNAKSSSNKPAYSKRRKKPRLAECESKLAQLKAENEQLKRHLEIVSNKAHKFDKEKEEAGKRIVQLQHKNVGPQEMNAAVREFSDMYSDYGVNRQQELSFHLEQLQRLVNPTNFTKMGLWTLGQSTRNPKRNPIAGILVKELTITPQQGRKILDQSEKIQKLCDNLKETHALLVKLKTLCEKKTQIFQDRMSKCTQILTSQQVVKLISWISEHTQLLESVCPGWGTEQAPLTSSKKPAAK